MNGAYSHFTIKLGICTSRDCGLHAADVELSYAHAWRPFAERSERKGITTKGIGELPWYPGLLSLMWRSGGFLFRLEPKILVLPKLTLAGVG
jgi:hypothetical protein